MYDVYKPIVYNIFLKKERKKRNIKLEDLSKQIQYSLGFISQLENSQDILNNEKISILLSFYGYDRKYLEKFDIELNRLLDDFIQNIFLIDDEEVSNSYQQLTLFFEDYSNEALSHAYHLAQFIYNLYFLNFNKVEYYYELVSQKKTSYSNKYQAILNIFMAKYYVLLMKYDQAIEMLTAPIFNNISDPNILGSLNITLSSCYMHKKDIAKAIRYCDDAIGNFTKANNYRRLLNTNITKANQLLKIKDYTDYVALNNTILKTAIKYNYTYEIKTVLHNNAFVYMMQNDYEKALCYYRDIPISEMREKHFCSYMICLAETDNDEEALHLSTEWKEKAINPYFKDIFEVYHNYLLNKDLLKLNKGLIRIVKTHKETIDIFEIEYLYVLIAYHYKKLNMYKSCMEYLEKLRELDFCK